MTRQRAGDGPRGGKAEAVREDRQRRDNRILLLLVLFLLCAGAGVVWWFRQQPPPGPPPSAQAVSSSVTTTVEPLAMTLYVPAENGLRAVSAEIPRRADPAAQAREALTALFADEQASQAPVLKDLRLRAIFLDEKGTAYLDVGSGPQHDIRASAREELLALYALTDTVMHTCPEVKQVRFLLNGGEAQTLAGHIDLSGAFGARMDLVQQ